MPVAFAAANSGAPEMRRVLSASPAFARDAASPALATVKYGSKDAVETFKGRLFSWALFRAQIRRNRSLGSSAAYETAVRETLMYAEGSSTTGCLEVRRTRAKRRRTTRWRANLA